MHENNTSILENVKKRNALAERIEQIRQARYMAENSLKALDLEEETLRTKMWNLREAAPDVLVVGKLRLARRQLAPHLVTMSEYSYSASADRCEFSITVSSDRLGFYRAQIHLFSKGQAGQLVMLRIEEPERSFEECLDACERHVRDISESDRDLLRGMFESATGI